MEHWQLPQGLLLPLPAAAGVLQGSAVMVSAPAGPLGEGRLPVEDEGEHAHSYAPHPAAVAAGARAQRWLASAPAGPQGEGRLASAEDDHSGRDQQHAADAAGAAAPPRPGPAASTEPAAGGRAFQVRQSFEEELRRELSQEGRQLAAESASRQLSTQQHGSDAAIGAMVSSNGRGMPGSAREVGRAAGGSGSTLEGAGRGGARVPGPCSPQQRQLVGTSVLLVPGVGVVPAEKGAAASAAATLGVPLRSTLGGTSSSDTAALDPDAAVAADPWEQQAAAAHHAAAAEDSSTAVGRVSLGEQQQQQQQGVSPRGGLVEGLWDSALMSYLQRDTALLEGITGKGVTV
ncbi:hypothetical protein COO60DRAFT_743512 [Scenedesmus sp. NREL 46B-D3]|nr:hypothetical protein COO60DRAFT_743512 [Scenedesmus sp. NREL 46B-D3]